MDLKAENNGDHIRVLVCLLSVNITSYFMSFFVLVLERLISFLWFGSVIVHGEWIYFLWSGSVLTYGGGSFLTCEDLGRMFDHSFLACNFFFFFFITWRLVCAH